MTSNINTNAINPAYPVAGTNNSSQGFRDNFTSIKNNLDTASTELSDLQSKALVKQALNGTAINNDMANTLISNAAVQGFRSPTHPLGTSIPSTIIIDVTKGDVQYGTIVQNTTIQFAGWAPTGTQSNVQVKFTIANSQALITFPNTTFDSSANITSGMTTTARILENYGSNGAPGTNAVYTNYVSVPHGVTELAYNFSTVNCGNTVDVAPLSRNRQAAYIESIASTSVSARFGSTGIGLRGDAAGKLYVDNTGVVYVCVGAYDGSSPIWGKLTLSGFA